MRVAVEVAVILALFVGLSGLTATSYAMSGASILASQQIATAAKRTGSVRTGSHGRTYVGGGIRAGK